MVALGLGTVQFGMRYGIANHERPSLAEAAAILTRAAEHANVTWLDTARDYEEAEQVIGSVLPPTASIRIVSKTPRLPRECLAREINARLRGGIEQTLRALRRDSIEVLLVHHADDLEDDRGDTVWDSIERMREQGLVQRIGLSAYTATQARTAAERFPLQVVQLPVNVFDQRLVGDGTLAMLRSRGIEVHARSIFLQGLLLMEPCAIPASLAGLRSPLERFRKAATEADSTPLAAAFSFINRIGVDAAIVGVATLAQFDAVLGAASCPASCLPEPFRFAVDDPTLIDPSQWRTLVHTTGSRAVVVRPADSGDIGDIFAWRNDPDTRRMFKSTAEVEWETHRAWFEVAISDPDRRLLIGEHEGQKIGIVRFDRVANSFWQISINLAPSARGRGLGTAMLEAAIASIVMRSGTLKAEVRCDNTVSRRMFERCGFHAEAELGDFIIYNRSLGLIPTAT